MLAKDGLLPADAIDNGRECEMLRLKLHILAIALSITYGVAGAVISKNVLFCAVCSVTGDSFGAFYGKDRAGYHHHNLIVKLRYTHN